MKEYRQVIKRTAGAVLLLLLIVMVSGALAAGPVFFVSPTGEYTQQAIQLTYVDGKGYYLFLPGNVNLSEWRIGFSGAETIELNGSALADKQSADILQEHNEIRFDRRRTVPFDVLRGSSDLPVLYITTESGKVSGIHHSKKNREAGYLYMEDASGKTEYDGNLTHIRIRGNSSVVYPKKNYQIKLEKGRDLLGFGKARKWVLTGNWLDKSFIRNQITYDLADYAGLPCTPEHQQAELYVNHEYMGLYLFSEKVEINEGRIDIRDLEKETEKLNDRELSAYRRKYRKLPGKANWKAFDIPNNPEDITGGYLIEYEWQKNRYKSEPSGYNTRRNVHLIIKSPEYATKEQADYVAAFMQGFENALQSEDGIDPDTGKHYSEFVDMDSLVLKYMINEFSQNYDGNISSEFFYKPEDSKSKVAFAGPVWDMDNTYAAYAQKYNKESIMKPTGLFIGKASGTRYWWPNLYKHEDFRQRIRELYRGRFSMGVKILLGAAEDPEGRMKSLEQYISEIAASAAMNFVRYPAMKYNWSEARTGSTFEENTAFLCDFIKQRAAYLESEWLQ
jgi:hypothetical protein